MPTRTLAALCTLAAWPALAAPPSPELLAKAAVAVKASKDLQESMEPLTSTVAEELDWDSGKPENTKVIVARERRDGGVRRTEVLVAEEDGKESEEIRQQYAKRDAEAAKAAAQKDGKKEEKKGLKLQIPFGPDEQARYAFDERGATPQGLVRVGFRPKGEPEEGTLEGEGELDPATGAVLRLQARPAKAPSGVQEMALELRWKRLPEGVLPAEVRMEGKARFLLVVRKRFRATTRLYWGAEADQEAARISGAKKG